MSTRHGDDDDDRFEPRDLREFEDELRRILEQRFLQAAQTPRQPTSDEARQLARMIAHMEVSDVAGRPRTIGALRQPNETARAAAPSERAPLSNAPRATPTPRPSRRRALLRWYGPLAAVVLGVALLRELAPDESLDAPPSVGLGARTLATSGAPPTNDVYLGADPGADQGQGAAVIEFTGRVTWDPRGQDGPVLVELFDRTDDQVRSLIKANVEGSEWTPTGRLPKRFRVVVDRPADDGLGREELHWAEYSLP